MAKDLRSFFKEYEEKHPEDILHIHKEISAVQEVTALEMKLEKQDRFPILIFHNIKTWDGRKSEFPLITNLLGSRTRCARLFNSTFQTVGRDFYELTRENSRKPQVVSRAQAPVQEVVETGDQIDLLKYPALFHHYLDAGPYFSSGFFTCYDPDSGIDNSSLHRGWIKEKNIVRVNIPRSQHAGWNFFKHEKKKQDMRCCFWLGHHPAALISSQAKLPYPGSHWEAMGGLLEESLRVVPSVSLGNDFLVPADAEVVVEGIMENNKRYAEGPFGEYPRYIGGQKTNPQMTVTAITRRKDAYWHDILVGHPDNQVMGGFAIEGAVYEAVKKRFPSLKYVYLPLSGVCRFHVYLQMENPPAGHAREAMMLALIQDDRIKHAFAFDEDVDIFNEREVLWAIATRSQWDRDVMVFPGTRGGSLDPSTGGPGENASGCIDCTKPWGKPFEEVVNVDKEVYDRVQLEEYIPSDKLYKIPQERM